MIAAQLDLVPAVCAIVAAQLGLEAEQVQPLHELRGEDLCCDEIDVIHITMALKSRFAVALADEEVARAETVAGLAGLLASKGARA